jgi:hypothetical protein
MFCNGVLAHEAFFTIAGNSNAHHHSSWHLLPISATMPVDTLAVVILLAGHIQ